MKSDTVSGTITPTTYAVWAPFHSGDAARRRSSRLFGGVIGYFGGRPHDRSVHDAQEAPVFHRILDPAPVGSLSRYVDGGGGAGLHAARAVEPEAIIGEIADAGLRGRGGAGFPTGRKWSTAAASGAGSVVVNAAEGEPGTFKDRALMRTNPYRMLEGALIAARAVGATTIRVGLPGSYRREISRLASAIEEMSSAGWTEGVDLGLLLGPESYLFGEETAMLEVMDGHQPFPRVVPPHLEPGAPDLVNNAETMANVPGIIASGAAWYREIGTDDSPGTVIATVTGDVVNHGVGEFAMGTPLRRVVDRIGWRLRHGDEPLMVLNGAANAPLGPDGLDTPLTHADMTAAGSGLGSASFIVFDDERDPVAVAEGVARFLGVESCGQCEPCKRDGLAIADHLRSLMAYGEDGFRSDDLERRLDSVATGARCNLARQQETVVGGILAMFGRHVTARVDGEAEPADPVLIAPIRDIVDGQAELDWNQVSKQPDWSHAERDSGTWPAAALADTPVHITVPTGVGGPSDSAEGRDGSFSENPFEMVAHDHHRLIELFEVVRHHPDDAAAVGDLGESLREHCDMGERILAPMVSRHGGAAGDDAVFEPVQNDRHMTAEAERLVTDGRADVERIDALAAEFRAHMDAEESMLDLLRRNMDPDELRDLARAMVEGELTA